MTDDERDAVAANAIADALIERFGPIRLSVRYTIAKRAIQEARAEISPTARRVSFTCPVCSRTSHNPNDEQEGYCGACHAFTGDDRIEVGIFEYGKVNLWCAACSRETGSGVFQRYPKPVDVRTLTADVAAHKHGLDRLLDEADAALRKRLNLDEAQEGS